MKDKLKVVIISSVIFPRNSPRSNRATELAKEFGSQGYDVTLYGVLGAYNYSEFERLYNVKVKNLGRNIFSNFNSDVNNSSDYIITRTLVKILGRWMEFPRIYLAKLTYHALRQEENIDLLITIAIPYPIHWGAALFRSICSDRLIKTSWVADCGDPYMGNPYQKKPFYFKYVEKWFCRKADFITVPIDGAKQSYYPEFHDKIRVIPQGFNFEDTSFQEEYIPNSVPTFVYAGVFYPQLRDPRPFLEFLSTLNSTFRFIVYTKNASLFDEYRDMLGEKLVINNYIPREELLKVLGKADFLVNFKNNTSVQSPSKLIDYALSQRPIMSLNSNYPLDKKLVLEFLEGDYSRAEIIPDLQKYNIRNVVSQFLALIPRRAF